MKAYRLEVLHRRTLGDGTKVSVKRRDAHARLAGQAVDGEAIAKRGVDAPYSRPRVFQDRLGRPFNGSQRAFHQ